MWIKKCKENLYYIARAQYSYLWMITSKNWFKRIVNITLTKLLSFHLRRFLSQTLCLTLSRFPNSKFKLLIVTNETRKYFIHSNRHLNLYRTDGEVQISFHFAINIWFQKWWYMLRYVAFFSTYYMKISGHEIVSNSWCRS